MGKRLYAWLILYSFYQTYIKPNPISGFFNTLIWLLDRNKYYLILSISMYYNQTDDKEKKEMINAFAAGL